MKAISIKQPWASLIAHGIKDIENRTWKTNFRGRVYIHVSAKSIKDLSSLFSDDQWDKMGEEMRCNMVLNNFPLSAIIGEVDIVDCTINHPSTWAEKTASRAFADQPYYFDKPIYNWVLSNPILYEKPILNVKGKLSFWDFNGLIDV